MHANASHAGRLLLYPAAGINQDRRVLITPWKGVLSIPKELFSSVHILHTYVYNVQRRRGVSIPLWCVDTTTLGSLYVKVSANAQILLVHLRHSAANEVLELLSQR